MIDPQASRGYLTFLRRQQIVKELSEKRLSKVIADSLEMTGELTYTEASAINLAAKLAYQIITHHGIELMWDEHDNFKGIVT